MRVVSQRTRFIVAVKPNLRASSVPSALTASKATGSNRSAQFARAQSTATTRSYEQEWAASMSNPEAFWREQAKRIEWAQPFNKVVDNSNDPFCKWYEGGYLNTAYNALDRHGWWLIVRLPTELDTEVDDEAGCQRRLADLGTLYSKCSPLGFIPAIPAVDTHGRGKQNAIVFHSAVTGRVEPITYEQLRSEVEAAAGMLRSHGVGVGDRVVVYMPMVPQAAVIMLACARIGAIHSVVFGGFAAHELQVRLEDAKPKVVVSASYGLEGMNKLVNYVPMLEGALKASNHRVEKVICLQRQDVPSGVPGMQDQAAAAGAAASRNGWLDWDSEIHRIRSNKLGADPVWVPSTHPQYIIYTSGSTGQPKGVVRDTGGHAVALSYAMEEVYKMKPGEVWFAGSDVGWVVGHSFIVYAPLLTGCTSVLFEGKPVGTPDPGTYFNLIDQHKVKALFTAPTALRAIKKEDPEGHYVSKYDTSSLHTLFVAGERCDPDTLLWARKLLGGRPVVDHWWSTEFGYPVLCHWSDQPGHTQWEPTPGSVGKPMPGWDVRVLSPGVAAGGDADFFANAKQLGPIAVRLPLPPGALTTLWNNELRYRRGYTDPLPGYFHTGDAGFRDEDGMIHVMGRIDDVINVAGHRLSTGAIEAAISNHPCVAECAVIGPHDDMKGQVPLAFVVLKKNAEVAPEQVAKDCVKLVRDAVGPVASFKHTLIVARIPKTRSGKVLRATLKSVADGTPFKVPATIDDPAILDEVKVHLQAIGFAKPKTAEELKKW